MTNQRLHRALQRWWIKAEKTRWELGSLGYHNPPGASEAVTVESPMGAGWVWVLTDKGTYIHAYNRGPGAVPLRANLRVRYRDDGGRKVIDGQDTSGLMDDDPNAPGTVYSVNDVGPDGSGNVLIDTDDIDEGAANLYYTAERARDDIAAALVAGTNITITVNDGLDTITIAAAGASYTDEMARDALAAALVAGTGITITPNDPADTITVATTITQYTDEMAQDAVGGMFTGNVETDIAVTYQDATAKVDFVLSPTLVGDRIHAATGKTTPVDADELGLADSAASFVLKKLTWANLKATLKTYFDTLYNLYVHPNHTGDVTSVGDGATTIAANAVTYAKMQDIATDSLIGRDTAATGDPETITLGASLSMTGAQVLQRAALTGDVTASANSNATTIANDAVTNAKAANMATQTIKGRTTAATGDPEDLTKAQVLTLLNVADGANAYVHPNHSGDVTSTGDGATVIGANKVLTAMIADAQLTLAKMANLATSTMIGRVTAGTGVPEALTATQVRTLLNITDGAAAPTAANVAAVIHAATLDTTPLDADEVPGLDSSASFALVRTTWTSIKAFLKTYFDTLYGRLASANIWTGSQTFSGGSNLIFTDPDVAHGITTDMVATDVYGLLTIYSGVNGGLHIGAASDAAGTPGLYNRGIIGVTDPTDTTPAVQVVGAKKAGAGSSIQALGNAETVWVLDNHSTRLITVLGDGNTEFVGAVDLDSTLNVDGAATLNTATVKPGSSADTAVVGGVLFVSTTTTASSGAGPDTLVSFTVPANTLSVNGQSLWVEAQGEIANNANTKDVRFVFNTYTMYASNPSTTGAAYWCARFRIFRTGAATQLLQGWYIRYGQAIEVFTDVPIENLAGALALSVKSTGVAANDVKITSFVVGWDNNNT